MILMSMKNYAKKKIAITLDKLLLKKIDKIKEYPRWRGNRSEVIEEGMNEFLSSKIKKESKCIFCNGTDNEIKQKKDYWVIVDIKKGIGVCSNCAFKLMQNPDKIKEVKDETTTS